MYIIAAVKSNIDNELNIFQFSIRWEVAFINETKTCTWKLVKMVHLITSLRAAALTPSISTTNVYE